MTVTRCAIFREDIERYNLPPDFTKTTDTRRAKFVARHGDMAVELDALPLAVLMERIETEIRARMDLKALQRTLRRTERDRRRIASLLGKATE